uniref:Uncharacterized protein n=1 Tax=Vibrio parahaemolyticus TaxID=670 RepID=A0A0C5GWX1_VIBPH|nr:hypothetical protein pVPH1_0026 [Vibrio parahaemolyticus]
MRNFDLYPFEGCNKELITNLLTALTNICSGLYYIIGFKARSGTKAP